MKSFVFYGLVVAGACIAGQAFVPAVRAVDDKVLQTVYHEGLKAYFAGDYRTAHDALTQAIEGGSKDPRCYYFRGFANARLGRTVNAQLDFTKGAELEGQDFDTFYNVSAALERVQGADRKALETYRRSGRKNALAQIEKIRFEQFRRFDPNQGVTGAATVGAGQAPTAGGDAAAMPAAGAVPAADPNNPFGTTPAAAPAAPAGGNPFGAPPATAPAAPATPAAPAAPAGSNPFGGAPAATPATPAAPAGGNPFGAPPASAPATPAAPAAPAAAPPAATTTNPFGM